MTAPRMTSPSFADPRLTDPAGWRRLVPWLDIGGQAAVSPARLSEEDLARAADGLHDHGWFALPPVLPAGLVDDLRRGLLRLKTAGWPPVFIHVFDQAWALQAALAPLGAHLLGERFAVLPHLWAWVVPPVDGARGWPGHRDLIGRSVFPGGIHMTLSFWVPLADAGLDNGCMRVVPREVERSLPAPLETLIAEGRLPQEPEEIGLALPAAAGSVLGWRQDLYHWSGRARADAAGPRISIAIEMQNTAFDPVAEPLIRPDTPPDMQTRVDLILRALGTYARMERIPDRLPIETLAQEFQ